ncbi:hypothetical protein BDK51DRAFT_33406 [Blyttiomyces helicus]|uniref:Uncharacterized protein n=1 Tax=Blyttiomyces helicus TaxID=388810 RepID=A0A4P9WQM2_9FUNG|nr:hypothetical protein BDK51DRAFT_33406 [Blyttiomyces helicus]|eukprot:RKO94695.1 hypothetical protein BDK51DRAFT_33406 [Blyttiomyces helicus]
MPLCVNILRDLLLCGRHLPFANEKIIKTFPTALELIRIDLDGISIDEIISKNFCGFIYPKVLLLGRKTPPLDGLITATIFGHKDIFRVYLQTYKNSFNRLFLKFQIEKTQRIMPLAGNVDLLRFLTIELRQPLDPDLAQEIYSNCDIECDENKETDVKLRMFVSQELCIKPSSQSVLNMIVQNIDFTQFIDKCEFSKEMFLAYLLNVYTRGYQNSNSEKSLEIKKNVWDYARENDHAMTFDNHEISMLKKMRILSWVNKEYMFGNLKETLDDEYIPVNNFRFTLNIFEWNLENFGVAGIRDPEKLFIKLLKKRDIRGLDFLINKANWMPENISVEALDEMAKCSNVAKFVMNNFGLDWTEYFSVFGD